METVGSLISFFAALFAVLSHNTLSGGMAGLSVSYSLSVSPFLLKKNSYFCGVFYTDCHSILWDSPQQNVVH